MKYLKQFIHPQWGSVVGSEKEIRLAVLQDEIEIWEQRLKNDPDSIPYLEYIRDTLKSRIEELQPSIIIQEHEMTWGNEYE
jgi:predicted  nucleic acid-binding Zn-ribbon protein|tara:strand:+ start:720 stop:962 length:243 start_codon:yes stop_codon:yes gene_type:complete